MTTLTPQQVDVPPPPDSRRSDSARYLWLALGLAFFLVANGRWIIPAATWLFPVFMIRFLRTRLRRLDAVAAASAYAAAMMITWWGMLDAPAVIYFPVVGGIGLVMFLPFLADMVLAPRLSGFLATLAFPLAFTTVEYVVSLVNPYGTWTFLGYTQYGNLPLMQLASVTGIFGLTFVITWFGSVVNWMWESRLEWSTIRRGVVVYGVAMATVLLFGGAYLAVLSPTSEQVKVAGVQSNLLSTLVDPAESEQLVTLEEQIDYAVEQYEDVIDDLFSLSETAAQGGANVVSWAEATVGVYREDEPALIARGSELAQQEDIYLVLAYATVVHTDESLLPEEKMFENKYVWIDPDGDVLATYLKANLVPGDEASDFIRGDNDVEVITTPYGRLAASICFENDFPSFTRTIGRDGADILINPSSDWVEIDPYHTHIQAFRAIENGFSTVRVTNDGLSAAYDYQGRTLAAMDSFRTSDRVFTAHVPIEGTTTVYSVIGDLFSWLSVAGLLAVSGRALAASRR